MKFRKGHKMGFMALQGRLKYIFIVPKHRLIQIIQRKKKHIVQINFVGKNYLYATASGNSLWSGYRAIAEGDNRHCFVAYYDLKMLPQAVIYHFA